MKNFKSIKQLQSMWRDPYAQWWAAGMPEFECVSQDPEKQLNIRFKTKEDREAFGEKVGLKLTDKTESMWFPLREKEENMKNRYREE